MITELFGYTLEINFYKSGYSERYAKKLLSRYWLNPAQKPFDNHKIGLIKLLRMQIEGLSLKDAKDAVEKMFEFESNSPRVK